MVEPFETGCGESGFRYTILRFIIHIMKRFLSSLTVLFIAAVSVFSQESKQSPFVGAWDWSENIDSVQCFWIDIGERNDSLLFAIGGVFYCGNKIHTGGYDSEFNDIAQVRVKKRPSKIIKSKISESLSNFYGSYEDENKYNLVSFDLLNDTTMRFILNDNKGYWPDTAIMFRRDRKNRKFSLEEEPLLYKKEVK